MSDKLRRIAVIGGSRIPFCRSNSVYFEKSNMDLLAAELGSRSAAEALEVTEVTRASLEDVRVDVDRRSEKLGYKIREGETKKVPYLLVVGDREKDSGSVAVRLRNGEDLGVMSVDGFAERLQAEVAKRA